ncbi:glycosyltransferase [Flavobacterium sp.]|uniref:glycosyltransferase family 2 protein n=1 Tax=Flavobacterium sp. TaxID=239 RepID=UPI0025BE75F5|nr:glycosyltransferase [Flavobacterium sp.]
MSIGILITNYNTWAMTSEAIQHCIVHSGHESIQITVVDDASTEAFNNQFENQIRLIKQAHNQGLIKSLNLGLSSIDTELICIFDSDAWPLEPFTQGIKEYFTQNPTVGIAAFKTEDAHGFPNASFEAEPGYMSIVLGQKIYQYYQKVFLRNPKSITVYTCAMVIRKKVLDEIGLFDENFDWLELDHDICMRAIRKGWGIGILPLRAFHKGSGTPQKVSHRVIRFYKNRWYLLRKFNKIKNPALIRTLVLARILSEKAVLLFVGRFLFKNKEVFNDKVHGRNSLIETVKKFK